jgi:carbonic anhydrase
MCLECSRVNRRHFMRMAGAGFAAAGLWGAAKPGFAETTLTPDQALDQLKAGNQKYVAAPDECEMNLAATRQSVAKAQSPWAAILSCADSRVPPELIFGGASLGELFVARNAGNIADTDVIGTLEYGTAKLGVPLILVLGHQRCGAVKAACDVVQNHTVLPGSIKSMVDAILPAAQAEYGKPGDFVDLTVRENARRNAEKIKSGSEIISGLIGQGKVKLVYGEYSLDTGEVTFLG